MQYVFISDCGHGWLKVPKKDIAEIKSLISPFSYQSKNYVFLEEDLDLSIFCKFMKAKGIDPNTTVKSNKNYRNYAPIRRYPSYGTMDTWARDKAYEYLKKE